MTTERMSFKCPCCANVINLDKKAVRTDVFLCPACLEGEILVRAAQPETRRAASVLLGKTGGWVIVQPSFETVSMS